MKKFSIQRQVEFNHCDFAGIVYFARYFEMISALIERFFADAIDFSWKDMLSSEQPAGTPIGDIHTRFLAPSRLGDWLLFELEIKKITSSTVLFAIHCFSDKELRFICETTLVYIDTKKNKAQNWPEAVIEKFYNYQSETLEK